MAKKLTEQQQDSIRNERIYQNEKSRIEMKERYSKKRTRSRIIEGIGKIATGRGREGERIIRKAVEKRVEDKTRNTVENATNEAIHKAEQAAKGQGLGQRTDTVSFQIGDKRGLPDQREGSNGMTVDQLTKLNELKKGDPQKYKEEMQRIFGVGSKDAKQTANLINQENNVKHGLKL